MREKGERDQDEQSVVGRKVSKEFTCFTSALAVGAIPLEALN